MASLKTAFIVASVVSTAIIVLAVLIASFPHKPDLSAFKQVEKNYAIVTFDSSAAVITAEIADTEQARATGLMNRTALGENEGMFFVFPQPGVQDFWMKNTLIPLDMIFISDDLSIVKIRHAFPCVGDPCQTYSSAEPAKYVLEVNGNLTEVYGIEEGSKIEITK